MSKPKHTPPESTAVSLFDRAPASSTAASKEPATDGEGAHSITSLKRALPSFLRMARRGKRQGLNAEERHVLAEFRLTRDGLKRALDKLEAAIAELEARSTGGAP